MADDNTTAGALTSLSDAPPDVSQETNSDLSIAREGFLQQLTHVTAGLKAHLDSAKSHLSSVHEALTAKDGQFDNDFIKYFPEERTKLDHLLASISGSALSDLSGTMKESDTDKLTRLVDELREDRDYYKGRLDRTQLVWKDDLKSLRKAALPQAIIDRDPYAF
jgi:hypothetical protein